MEIEKLKDRLLEWDGVDTVDNGEFIEVNYHGAFDLLKEAATALEQIQAENDRLKQERDTAVAGLHGCYDACQHYTLEHGNDICGSCVYEYPLFHRDGVVIEDTAGNGLELRR